MKQKKIRLEITQLEFAKLIREADEAPTSELKKIIDKKIHDMAKRDEFTTMLNAKTPEEYEEARKTYLNMIGVPESFRW